MKHPSFIVKNMTMKHFFFLLSANRWRRSTVHVMHVTHVMWN